MEEAGRELVRRMWAGDQELLWIYGMAGSRGVEAWSSPVVPGVPLPPQREVRQPCDAVCGGQRPSRARVRLPGLCGVAWPGGYRSGRSGAPPQICGVQLPAEL
jgi:hypothetical protein